MIFQKTISEPVEYKGIGLHKGEQVSIVFKPAPPDTGIVFRRVDIPGHPEIPARIDNVIGVLRGTSLGHGDVKVHTVEHVLCACAGIGITNLICELNASEPPAADGSSYEFVKIIQKAGIKLQEAPYREISVKEPIVLSSFNQKEGYQKYLIALPCDEFRVSFTIDYDHPAIGTQFAEYVINEKIFLSEIMPARTFGFKWEKEALNKVGLALGGSLENAIVMDEENVLNDSLRYKDEFVRHKILDIIGDLFLMGAFLKAHIIALKSGHDLNIQLAQELEKRYLTQDKEGKIILKEIIDGQILTKPVVSVDALGVRDAGPAPAAELGIERAEDQFNENTSNKIEEKKLMSDISAQYLDLNKILEILPHRYPFLLVDRIVELNPGVQARGIKNVTINEPFFQGHFPGHPIMPGVLIVEAMAQVAGVCMLSESQHKGKLPYFAGIDDIRFKKPVLPGDQVDIHIEVLKVKGTLGKVSAVAKVEDKVVVKGTLMFKIV